MKTSSSNVGKKLSATDKTGKQVMRFGMLFSAALTMSTLAMAQLPAGTSDASAPVAAGPNDALLNQANDALEKSDFANAGEREDGERSASAVRSRLCR